MGTLIDSSILVAYEKGRLDIPAQIKLRSVIDARISVIVASEMLHGIARSKDPAIQAKVCNVPGLAIENWLAP